MRRTLVLLSLAAATLLGGGTAGAAGCSGAVNACPEADSCSGTVDICPAAQSDQCDGNVDVCLGISVSVDGICPPICPAS